MVNVLLATAAADAAVPTGQAARCASSPSRSHGSFRSSRQRGRDCELEDDGEVPTQPHPRALVNAGYLVSDSFSLHAPGTANDDMRSTHEVAGASAESDPWCLETPRLSEFCHCMPCHGHSRCTFHAACTPRSCTAHARDFDARAMRLSWSSGHNTPHVWPASYPMIRNLRTLK